MHAIPCLYDGHNFISPLISSSSNTTIYIYIYLYIYVYVYRERFDEIGKKIKRESDAPSNQNMGRRHMLGPPGTLNTITPCAACKLLRRRCAQECPFSPYFSPHEPQKFASVHKVFGASNVSKMLMVIVKIVIYYF